MQYEERYYEKNGEMEKIALPSRGSKKEGKPVDWFHEWEEKEKGGQPEDGSTPLSKRERCAAVGKGLFIGGLSFLVLELVAFSSLYSATGFAWGFFLTFIGLALFVGCEYVVPALKYTEQHGKIEDYFHWYKETSTLLNAEASYRAIQKPKAVGSSLDFNHHNVAVEHQIG